MTEVIVRLQSKTQSNPIVLTISESTVKVETEGGSVDLCAFDFKRLIEANNKNLLFDFLHRMEKVDAPSKNPPADLKKMMPHIDV